MGSIDDRIKQLLKGDKNPDKDVLEKIQFILLMDTNNQIPLNYIKEQINE